MKIHYLTHVVDRYHRGWLEAVLGSGNKVSIPYSTRVVILRKAGNYQDIKVLEGEMKNQKLTVPYLRKLGQEVYSFFSDDNVIFSKLNIIVNSKASTLLLNNKSYSVLLGDGFEKGIYYVKFPVRRNKDSALYSDEVKGGSRFFDTWFPLIRKGEFNLSRFFHFGSFSKGCITVKYNPEKKGYWSELFFKLMHSRIDDNYLARIEVD